MIKYNSNTINNWYYGDDNIIKVYRNGAVCYYKIITSGGTTAQTPCYAVVNDISQYQDTEFEDVFNNGDGKWYKLNNLNQYEEYGVYGDSIASGGTSRLPQGYTEVEYVENQSLAYIDTNFKPNQDTRIQCKMECVTSTYNGVLVGCGSWDAINAMRFNYEPRYNGTLHVSYGTVAGWTVYNNYTGGYTAYEYDWNKNEFYRDGTLVGSITYGNFQCTDNLGIFWSINHNSTTVRDDDTFKGKIYYFRMYDDGALIRNLVPCTRDSDSKAGLYDLVNDVFYTSANSGYELVAGSAVTPTAATYYQGKLAIVDGYEYIYSGNSWQDVGEISGSTIPDNYVIPFEDSNVKALCVNNWGGNVVAGELTYGEAKQVTSLGSVFKNNKSITSFNELAYFKGITAIYNGEFAGCTSLTDIVIPNNVRYLGYNSASRATFSGCTNLSGITMISGGDLLTTNLTANNGSYYMNSSHANVPMVFPDREITMSGSTFGYYDYLSIVYFQSSTPPTNLANADINNYRKLTNVYCPVGSLSAYESALTGKGKTIREYDFETDSLGLLDKEKEWTSKTGTQTIYPVYYSEKSDPPNNLSFSSMTEAEEYECPWVGMQATIDGVRYIFSGDSTSGYEWVEKPTPSYKYWMWRSTSGLSAEGTIQFSEFDLVADGADVNLTYISGIPSGFTGQGLENLFDNNIYTKYCANLLSYKATNYVLFEAPNAISPTIFSMTTANDSASYRRHPDEWVLFGSNTSTTNWNDGSWDLVLSGTCGSEMSVNYTRFNFPITYN